MKNILRKVYSILTAVMLLSVAGCGGKEEGPIVWKKIKTMDEGQYAIVQVDDSFLRAEEHLSETVYCSGYVYFFKVRVIDDMRLNPEYFSVGCMNMETGETRLLYEAPKYIVLQDIIAAEDKVYWVEIDYNEVSEWKIVFYDLEQETLGVVRKGILEEDTCWEPVLTLSDRYILWDEKRPDGAYTCFQYSLDDGSLREWPIQEYNSYDFFEGNRVYDGKPIYLSKKDGSFEIKNGEKVFYQMDAENVRNYSITQQGILWMEGEAERKAWFVRMENNVVSEQAQALSFPKIFTAELYEEWILLVNETAVGNRYYAINVNTGEQFYVPAEGFYYPRRSADGTIYFKGSGGRVLLLNLPDKQIF